MYTIIIVFSYITFILCITNYFSKFVLFIYFIILNVKFCTYIMFNIISLLINAICGCVILKLVYSRLKMKRMKH